MGCVTRKSLAEGRAQPAEGPGAVHHPAEEQHVGAWNQQKQEGPWGHLDPASEGRGTGGARGSTVQGLWVPALGGDPKFHSVGRMFLASQFCFGGPALAAKGEGWGAFGRTSNCECRDLCRS